MRIAELQVIQARIPLKRTIQHASQTRSENDSILVRCELDDGSVGWGEGLPRPYVTGETIETAWQHLNGDHIASLGARFSNVSELTELAGAIDFKRTPGKRECFGNAARCALELAILDAGCRALQLPLSEFIRQLPQATGISELKNSVEYSAVLTSLSMPKLRLHSWLFRLFGFRQCKLKVGVPGQEDHRRVHLVRSCLGPDVSLRLDANEAWSAKEALARIEQLIPFQVESVEQPVPHEHRLELQWLRQKTSVPIMLDESLCSLEDADFAIQHELCDAFNLRLSKCGGIIPTLQLAALAHKHGQKYQLGCQVGETGILSAAGRHFATAIAGLNAVEGSFDRFLVKERLTKEDLTFGWGGRGTALHAPGLGVTIEEHAVNRVTLKRACHTIS